MRISDWSSDVCSSDLVGECGGAVLFEKEMSDPGKRIAGDQRDQEIPPNAFGEAEGEASQRQAAADEVQAPRRGVGVLGQIERIELGERLELRLGHREDRKRVG